ncbi:hypothetical protein OG203_11075 [Nocardia sp. NBC_01499]|uniref:hypothetical protein n=1 Tax=Nocardia sp. NBC_01499 TaxID=2903597 RepID=UPI0038701B70
MATSTIDSVNTPVLRATSQRRDLYQSEFGLNAFFDRQDRIVFYGGLDAAARVVAMPRHLGVCVRSALLADRMQMPIISSLTSRWLFLTGSAPKDSALSILFGPGSRFAKNDVVLMQGVLITLPTPGCPDATWISAPSGRDRPPFNELFAC